LIELKTSVAEEVLRAATRTGGDFAEIFLEDSVGNSVTMRSGKIETVSTNRIHGAGIRVFNGTNVIYCDTNDTTREGLIRCAEQAAAAVNAGAGTEIAPFNVRHAERPEEIRRLPTDVSAREKAEKVRACEAAGRAVSPEITQVVAGYSDSIQDVLIANTEGVFVTDRRVRGRLHCNAVAAAGGENQTGSCNPGASMGFEIFDSRVDPEATGKEAARQAVTMLHAPACPAGVMPVVIDSGFGGVIFHEACGHSLEATSVAFHLSEFSDKIGQKIAADCVTAVDDGTLTGEWGSIHVDDEGMETNRLVLIQNGILINYMIDKMGGRRMGMAPTGSARRQSYGWAPTSRMRSTFICAGEDDEDEMIATMGDGLYAKEMGGGSVNPSTGEFNFSVREGYLVKGGKILHPVRGASLIGRGSEVLIKIDRVGRNLRLSQGVCGSASGSVPVDVGQPMIRVSSLTVGGQ